jgi:hypothetical protein
MGNRSARLIEGDIPLDITDFMIFFLILNYIIEYLVIFFSELDSHEYTYLYLVSAEMA